MNKLTLKLNACAGTTRDLCNIANKLMEERSTDRLDPGRDNTIMIDGLAELNDSSHSEQLKQVLAMLNEQFAKLDLGLESRDILNVEHVGKKADRPGPVKTELHSDWIKEIMRNRSDLESHGLAPSSQPNNPIRSDKSYCARECFNVCVR